MDKIRELVVSAYIAPPPIKAFNSVPRFGHSSDISIVFDENGLNVLGAQDYARGTLFVAGFCLAAFICWILALLVLKCMGRRAGIAAGHPFVENVEMGITPRKHTRFRILMLLSTITISISGVIFLVRGARSVGNTFDDVRDGALGLSNIADSIVNATDKVILFGENTEALRDTIIEELEDPICEPDGSGGPADQFDSAANQVVNVLGDLQNFAKSDLTQIRDTFSMEFTTVNSGIYDNAEKGEQYAEPMWVATPVIVFGLILCAGAYLAWKGPYIKSYFAVQTWLILPLFFVVVVIMAIVLSLLGTVLVANSDVCLGGESKTPEGFVEIVLQKAGLDGDALEATNYYIVDSCTGEYSRKIEVDNLLIQLGEAVAAILSLKIMLDTEPETFIDACDNANSTRIAELSVVIDQSFEAFTEFVAITYEAADVLECPRINNVFVDFYHDALCTSGPYSLMWMFATMMAVYVLGMFIVLSRGALLPSEKIYDGTASDYERDDNYYNEKNDASQDRSSSGSRGASETDEASQAQDNDDKLFDAVVYDDNPIVRGYDFENDAGVIYEEDNDGNSYDANER